MIEAVTTLTKLLIVQDIQEDSGGATVRFRDGAHGRLAARDGDYATYLRLARRSHERQHPLGVSFGDGQTIAALMRADNDVPTKLWEENGASAHVLFQGHDGVFRLKRDHPHFARLSAVLADAIGRKTRVWFISQSPDLALMDLVPAG
jgi:hypothetical protein